MALAPHRRLPRARGWRLTRGEEQEFLRLAARPAEDDPSRAGRGPSPLWGNYRPIGPAIQRAERA